MPHQFTKVTMEDFDYVALIDHADHVDQINHGMVIGNLMGWDIPKNCGTHQSTTFGGGHLRSKGLEFSNWHTFSHNDLLPATDGHS